MSISLQQSVQQLWPVFATASISYRAGETLKVRPNRRSRQALQRPVDVFNEVAKLLLRLSERHVGFDAWKTLNVSTRILSCDSCGFPHCKRASKQTVKNHELQYYNITPSIASPGDERSNGAEAMAVENQLRYLRIGRQP